MALLLSQTTKNCRQTGRFWDPSFEIYPIFYLNFLKQEVAVTVEHISIFLKGDDRDAIRKKRPSKLLGHVILLDDNVWPDETHLIATALTDMHWEVLQYFSYSPDLSPSDFHLFGSPKKHLGEGGHFGTKAVLQHDVLQ